MDSIQRKTQRRRRTALLVAGTLGAGFVAGGVVVGGIVAFGDPAPEPTYEAAATTDPLPLLNTATVLFPIPPRDPGAIDEERLEFAMHLVDVEPATWVVADLADVHTGPGTGYEFVSILLPGTEVVIDGEVGPWRRIADDGGYVLVTYLQTVDGDGPPALSYAVTGTGVLGDAGGCGGGVSLYEPITEEIGHPYWLVNSYCGGEPLAELAVGDPVVVDGEQSGREQPGRHRRRSTHLPGAPAGHVTLLGSARPRARSGSRGCPCG